VLRQCRFRCVTPIVSCARCSSTHCTQPADTAESCPSRFLGSPERAPASRARTRAWCPYRPCHCDRPRWRADGPAQRTCLRLSVRFRCFCFLPTNAQSSSHSIRPTLAPSRINRIAVVTRGHALYRPEARQQSKARGCEACPASPWALAASPAYEAWPQAQAHEHHQAKAEPHLPKARPGPRLRKVTTCRSPRSILTASIKFRSSGVIANQHTQVLAFTDERDANAR
jgi:hypothetical protein